jgi:hypothetical protein
MFDMSDSAVGGRVYVSSDEEGVEGVEGMELLCMLASLDGALVLPLLLPLLPVLVSVAVEDEVDGADGADGAGGVDDADDADDVAGGGGGWWCDCCPRFLYIPSNVPANSLTVISSIPLLLPLLLLVPLPLPVLVLVLVPLGLLVSLLNLSMTHLHNTMLKWTTSVFDISSMVAFTPDWMQLDISWSVRRDFRRIVRERYR